MCVVPGYEWPDGIVDSPKLIGSKIGERFPNINAPKRRSTSETAVTNARFAPLHGAAGRPCPPLDRARSTSQNRALVTSGIRTRAAKSGRNNFRWELGSALR